jgi:glycosyltransferase involved in cell wall biosynthesis
MQTITLHITSESTDLADLNRLVDESDKAADILLLSDYIEPHGDITKGMVSCLDAAEKHAIAYGYEIENNKSLIETAWKYLPEYDLTVQVNDSCVLIKRSVIDAFGFLDESYSSLQYALMDFYCRINKFGFSSIVSYHSLYSCKDKEHSKPVPLCSKDKELFESRYDYWGDKYKRIERYGANPCAEFLKVIDNEYYPRKRILFDCIIMPAMHCGTSEYQISSYDAFYRLYKDKYDIFLYTNREAAEYHKLSEKYGNILYPDTIEGVFHLGYAPNQLMFYEPMLTMNKHCLKIVQTLFDIMMVRIDEHVADDVSSNVEAGIGLSDGIVFISDFTKKDFLACFANNNDLDSKQLKVIYPATGFTVPKNEYEIPFEDYFLVIGNAYKHKAIKETIEIVSATQENYIVVGYGESDYIFPNVYSLKSGTLDEDYLSYLFAKCKAVVFPSLYEGFGFPIVHSLKSNKHVIVNNNALNRELIEHFNEFKRSFLFFDRFEQIGEIIEKTNFSTDTGNVEYIDSWERVATELETLFGDILKADMDAIKLTERWNSFKTVESNLINAEPLIKTLKEENLKQHDHIQELSHEYRTLTGEKRLSSLLVFTVKTYARNRFPRFISFLKGVIGR